MTDDSAARPRLEAVAGPLKGAAFALGDEEVSVGRESSNLIPVSDNLLSRRHCLFKQEGKRFKVVDLGSVNGTSVNGVPVKEHFLEHGDQVTVGESRFVFLLRGGVSQRDSNPVHLSEQGLSAGRTVRLRVGDALYLRPQDKWSSLPPLGRMARDLTVLVRVSTAVNAVRGVEALQRELLQLIFEVVPAERGAILLAGDDLEITSVFGWDRAAGPERPVSVSRTVVRQVLEEGAAVLSNDAVEGPETGRLEDHAATRTSSLLCVPLTLFGRALGAVYLDTTDADACFREEHLHLVTVISGIAAVALENARHVERLEGENLLLRADQRIEHNMIGEGEAMRRVYQFISRVAPADSTVLVTGESGTGKELAAHAIHRNSPRREGPFVAINCAALTESLLESELFGHERGAFTGAVAQKKGKFELAGGGTVFLDEVGELAPVLQAKLLRVLQEREFERVGGSRPLRADVRVIAATNRDLGEAVKDGSFRQDLFYRLNVVPFEMPPLRKRREDVPLLASHFVAKYGAKCNRKVTGLSKEALACLTAYDWPGNVRELENAVERAIVLSSTEHILPEDLPENILESEPEAGAPPAPVATYHEAIREAKKQLIIKAVEQSGGSYSEAAKLLGVHPNYLHRLVRNLNLRSALKKG